MMEKNSKIYVAGHTGLVGSAITKRLQTDGYANLILKTRAELDLFNQQAVKDFYVKEQPEYVIVSAAKTGGIKASMEHQADFLYENLEIQNNVIWEAHIAGVRKLLFLGSSCIYPRDCPQPMKEEYLMDGKSEPTNEGYTVAKIAGLKLCEYIYTQYNKQFISCMPTNLYGPGDNFSIERSHVIPGLIRRVHEAKIQGLSEVVVWGSGNSRREFLYVDDMAEACIWLMNNYTNKQFLNIGTGEDISIKELAFMIKNMIGYTGELIFDITKPDGMPKKLLDVSKMSEMGWKHTIQLQEGIQKAYKRFLESM